MDELYMLQHFHQQLRSATSITRSSPWPRCLLLDRHRRVLWRVLRVCQPKGGVPGVKRVRFVLTGAFAALCRGRPLHCAVFVRAACAAFWTAWRRHVPVVLRRFPRLRRRISLPVLEKPGAWRSASPFGAAVRSPILAGFGFAKYKFPGRNCALSSC